MAFGEYLREQRARAQLTQAEAARRAGMTRAMWAKLEADENGTRRSKVPAIARAIEAPLSEVYRAAGFDPGADADPGMQFAMELEDILSRAAPERRPLLRAQLKAIARVLVG